MTNNVSLSNDEKEESGHPGSGGSVETNNSEERILDQVLYDVNGDVHQAVRIAPLFDTDGNYCKPVARYCSMKLENMTKSKHELCLLTKTRIKCKQCRVPLCYHIKTMLFGGNQDNRRRYCFIRHVEGIPKLQHAATRDGRSVSSVSGMI